MSVLILFTLFIFKHFIVDFLFQTPYMYKNKGTYLHGGGLLHAYLHGGATYILILTYVFITGNYHTNAYYINYLLIDFLLHYHIDYIKVNICHKFNLKPDNSEWFWYLLGLDQLLHYLTYVVIIWLVLG